MPDTPERPSSAEQQPPSGGQAPPASNSLTTLGDFEIRREIGRGGMGTVYEAWDRSLQRTVALKVLSSQVSAAASSVRRFLREAQAAAKLHHMHIVPIFAQGEENGTYYYAMELVDGPSLHSIIGAVRHGPRGDDTTVDLEETVALDRTPVGAPGEAAAAPPAAQTQVRLPCPAHSSASSLGFTSAPEHFEAVARHLASIADALDHAHAEGVVHRDVKPHNLLLGSDGRMRISDFGLARIAEQPGVTVTGELLGSPLYMSTEQILEGPAKVDHRTDIYSLGATMYEWLTLKPPYPGETREQVIRMIASSEPMGPRVHNPVIPVPLETICLKAIERDRSRRYQTAGEFRDDLRRFIEKRPIKAKRTALTTRLGKFLGRHQLASFGAVAAVIAVALAWALHTKQSEVQTQAAAIREAQLDAEEAQLDAEKVQHQQELLLDVLNSLPIEIGGTLRAAEAAVEGLVETGQRIALPSRDESQVPSAAGTPRGIVRQAVYDLYDDLRPRDWADGDGAPECAPALLGAIDVRAAAPDEAGRAVEACLLARPGHFEARQLRVALYGHAENYWMMRFEARRLIDARASDPRGYLWSVLAHLLLDRGEEGQKVLKRAPAQNGTAAWTSTLRGLAFMGRNQPTDAVIEFDTALALSPNLTVALLGRAMAYAAVGDLENAIVDLSDVLQIEPKNAEVLALRGDHYMSLGRHDAALSDFELAMELSDRTPAMVGRWIAALMAQRNAAKNGPREAEATTPTPSEEPSEHPAQGWFSRYVWPRQPREREGSSTSPLR